MNPWDERYAPATYYYGTEPNEFLREQAPAIPSAGTILCLGEGEGRNAVYLAGKGHEVVALDQSAIGLEKSRRLASAKAVHIQTLAANLDGYRLEDARWDGIVSIWCHLPSAVRSPLHRQVLFGLKPGGVFVLEAYTPRQIANGTGGPRDLDLLPSLGELRRDLEGLEILMGTETDRIVQEGKGHTGLSAVVQIVGRRPT